MGSDLPSRLDRATFDRVLQRAAELQAASKDIGDGLSEEEILALGTEVGIPAGHLKQALIEERTRVTLPEPNGFLDRWVAPAEYAAQRVVQGTPDTIGATLTRWMENREQMAVQRSSAGRISWEPMESFARGMRRLGAVFDPKRGKPYLDKAHLVTAVITPLDAGFCHVALGASLQRVRAGYCAGATGLSASGAALGAVAVVSGAPALIALVVFVPMVVVGAIVLRAFRGVAQRTQLGLERAFDNLEQSPALPKSPGAQPGVAQVFRGIAKEVRKALEE